MPLLSLVLTTPVLNIKLSSYEFRYQHVNTHWNFHTILSNFVENF